MSDYKTCARCKSVKKLSAFNWKTKNEKRASYCKSCSRKYIKNHYLKNKGYYLAKAKKRNSRLRVEAQKILGNHFLKHPCVDCGETDILVLEFDHKDRTIKNDNIGSILRNNNLEMLMQEINKCVVRCANCHSRKTAKENNSWRLHFSNMRL